MKITCVGDCGVDYHIDHKILRAGGITLNFAVNARSVFPKKDDIQVIAPLGTDTEAQTVIETANKYTLIPFFTSLPGKTPVQYIDHDSKGEKIFTKYEEGVLADYTVGPKEQKIIEGSDFVMTVIFTQMEKFFESVVKNKPKGLMGVDFMNLGDYSKKTDIVKKHIDSFDIGFFGLNSSQDTELIKQLKELAQKHDKLFIITLGENGSSAYTKSEDYYAKAIPVKNVIDTTGAGDTFAASFVKEYLMTNNVQKSLEFGNIQAAKVIQRVGAF